VIGLLMFVGLGPSGGDADRSDPGCSRARPRSRPSINCGSRCVGGGLRPRGPGRRPCRIWLSGSFLVTGGLFSTVISAGAGHHAGEAHAATHVGAAPSAAGRAWIQVARSLCDGPRTAPSRATSIVASLVTRQAVDEGRFSPRAFSSMAARNLAAARHGPPTGCRPRPASAATASGGGTAGGIFLFFPMAVAPPPTDNHGFSASRKLLDERGFRDRGGGRSAPARSSGPRCATVGIYHAQGPASVRLGALRFSERGGALCSPPVRRLRRQGEALNSGSRRIHQKSASSHAVFFSALGRDRGVFRRFASDFRHRQERSGDPPKAGRTWPPGKGGPTSARMIITDGRDSRRWAAGRCDSGRRTQGGDLPGGEPVPGPDRLCMCQTLTLAAVPAGTKQNLLVDRQLLAGWSVRCTPG